jgi:hypothetical protein
MALTTPEDIRVKWRTSIWNHASILAITDKVLEQDLTEETHKELSRLRYDQKINFFAFRVLQMTEQLLMGKYRLRFQVEISYTRWANPSGSNYNLVADTMALVQNLVLSELGSTWDGLVANAEPQNSFPNVSVVTVGDEPAFRAEYSYTAFICNI